MKPEPKDRPIRIQLSRKKGFRLGSYSRAVNGCTAVSVARPSMWGNPFIVTEGRSARDAVSAFRTWLTTDVTAGLPERKAAILANLPRLRGKNLACWCKPGAPCHADVLLELANKEGGVA